MKECRPKYEEVFCRHICRYTLDNESGTLTWEISDINDFNNKRSGYILKEACGYNFILLDLNVYKKQPVINLVFKHKNIKIELNNKLCFKLEDESVIELLCGKNEDLSKQKSIFRYYITREAINILQSKSLVSVYIQTNESTGRMLFKDIIGLSFASYVYIYKEILDNHFPSVEIPKHLDSVKIVPKVNINHITSHGEDETLGPYQDNRCSVYLMHDTSNNYYKIGISKNPNYRERTLLSEKPTIELLCSKEYPNRKLAQAFESALHKTYAEKRLRGEWFNFSEYDVIEIRQSLE